MTACWCGNASLVPFGPNYGVCNFCGTLVSTNSLTKEELVVENDETDFYGKQYWLGHQQENLGFPDIHTRSRNDLTERNLHWLEVLLKYCPPAKSVLELGCAHGSFVALLRQAGYLASGVEMSPWVVAFGKATFDVPIFVGPVESLNIPAASLDAIMLMDVLEHLPDPIATMELCLNLLKPEGLLLIQTPEFKEEMQYRALVENKSSFLDQLKADEHLYLFSKRSVSELFRKLGAEYIYFEPAIFAHYDMFFAVSRAPLKTYSPEEIESVLATPQGRMVLALLDVRAREKDLQRQMTESESDRANRAQQIETLTSMLKESEVDRIDRAQQIETLTSIVKRSEVDQVDRKKQTETLYRMLKESEADRIHRAKQIQTLTSMVNESKADQVDRAQQIETLTRMLKESEADRNDRMQQIEVLTSIVTKSEVNQADRAKQIDTLSRMLKDSEADRLDRGQQIETLARMLKESEVDRNDRMQQIETLTSILKDSEVDQLDRVRQIETLTQMLRESETDRVDRGQQIETLTRMLKAFEVDQIDRTRQIETLTLMLKDSERKRQEQAKQIEMLIADLQALLSRPLLRGLNRIVNWPELHNLKQRLSKHYE